jgi:hypothetical protein
MARSRFVVTGVHVVAERRTALITQMHRLSMHSLDCQSLRLCIFAKPLHLLVGVADTLASTLMKGGAETSRRPLQASAEPSGDCRWSSPSSLPFGNPLSRSYTVVCEGKLPLTLHLAPVLMCCPEAQYTLNAGTDDYVRHIWYLVVGSRHRPTLHIPPCGSARH